MYRACIWNGFLPGFWAIFKYAKRFIVTGVQTWECSWILIGLLFYQIDAKWCYKRNTEQFRQAIVPCASFKVQDRKTLAYSDR